MKGSLLHGAGRRRSGMPGRGEVRRSLHPAVQRSHDERCSSGSGWGSARSRAPARANAREGTSPVPPRLCRGRLQPSDGTRRVRFGDIRPLAREPRLVAARAAVRGFGPGLRCEGSAARARCGDGVGRGFGCARHGPSAVTVRESASSLAPEPTPENGVSGARERTLASGSHVRRGSDDRAVVLVDRIGCRSRRAALGPDRKVMGLAVWLPAPAGELRGRKGAGSRVAAAKAASTRAATPVAGSS